MDTRIFADRVGARSLVVKCSTWLTSVYRCGINPTQCHVLSSGSHTCCSSHLVDYLSSLSSCLCRKIRLAHSSASKTQILLDVLSFHVRHCLIPPNGLVFAYLCQLFFVVVIVVHGFCIVRVLDFSCSFSDKLFLLIFCSLPFQAFLVHSLSWCYISNFCCTLLVL